jgi:predicted alpha-1,6-mannanase (GH76 family)
VYGCIQQGIDEWVMDNLISRKPLVQDGLALFEFRGEAYKTSATHIGGIRQMPLDERLKQEIRTQQSSMQKAARLRQRVQVTSHPHHFPTRA